MHTIIATAAGFLVLAAAIALGRLSGLAASTTLVSFAVLWLIATVVHGAMGMAAGQTLTTELLVGIVVFGLPVAAAAFILR
jgi:hypothetical protein